MDFKLFTLLEIDFLLDKAHHMLCRCVWEDKENLRKCISTGKAKGKSTNHLAVWPGEKPASEFNQSVCVCVQVCVWVYICVCECVWVCQQLLSVWQATLKWLKVSPSVCILCIYMRSFCYFLPHTDTLRHTHTHTLLPLLPPTSLSLSFVLVACHLPRIWIDWCCADWVGICDPCKKEIERR